MARRPKSIVPQQYLFLLNSSFMVDRAKALVARLDRVSKNDEERIRLAYQWLYQRDPALPDQNRLRQSITRSQGRDPGDLELIPLGSGHGQTTFRARGAAFDGFIKWGDAASFPSLQAEAENLAKLAAPGAIRTPGVFALDRDELHAWLVLEHLALGPVGNPTTLGIGLARLHETCGKAYGWPNDNFIGFLNS